MSSATNDGRGEENCWRVSCAGVDDLTVVCGSSGDDTVYPKLGVTDILTLIFEISSRHFLPALVWDETRIWNCSAVASSRHWKVDKFVFIPENMVTPIRRNKTRWCVVATGIDHTGLTGVRSCHDHRPLSNALGDKYDLCTYSYLWSEYDRSYTVLLYGVFSILSKKRVGLKATTFGRTLLVSLFRKPLVSSRGWQIWYNEPEISCGQF